MRRQTIPLVMGALAAGTSAIGVTVPSVWYDEAATISASTRSLPELIGLLGNLDAVHGAYYLLMHAVFGSVGYSPLSLRLVSAIAVGIGAAIVVILDRRLRPGSRGVIAALIFCLLPRVAWMGAEGRSTALSAAIAALLTLVLLHCLDDDSRMRWVLYGAIVVVGCLVFVYFALVVLAHGVTVLLHRRRRLLAWAIAAGSASVMLVPFVIVVVSQSTQLATMPTLGEQTTREVLAAQWFGSSVILAALSWALILVGLIRSTPVVLQLVLPAIALPTALLLLGGLQNPELYQPRYLAMCTPFIALAMAAGVHGLRWPALRLAAIGGILVLAAPLFVAERAPDAKKDGAWQSVASIISEQRDPGHDRSTGIVFGKLFPHHATTARVISLAYPDAFEGMIDATVLVPAARYSRDLWGTWAPLENSIARLSSVDETFLITTGPLDGPESDAEIVEADGWAAVGTWVEGDITIVKYERPRQPGN